MPGDVGALQPAVPVLTPQPSVPAPGGTPGAPAAPDAAARIKQLDKLRASGAITEAEYARKRQKIVDDI